ncbi:MAG: DUF2846 domain-containing protein [Lysobacter sp.]|nr:DUF2846 domain-containing protein [Lysobacter sp.]
MTFRFLMNFAAACAGLAIAGCASVPVAGDALDREAKAFAVKAGKANLYVFRDDAAGAAAYIDILLDGVPMGRSGPLTYFAFEVDAGARTLTSRAENEASVTLAIEAGRNYFVRQESLPGWLYSRTRLRVVDEATGRAGVASCRLVPGTQEVEVRVESTDGAWRGPLACEASNAFGSRSFEAPGTVTVFASASALSISCRAPAGAVATVTATPPGVDASPAERAKAGAAAGAGVGAIAGIAVGAAAVPVMGPALAIMIAAGSIAKGGEIGGMAGALGAGEALRYPSPIVLRIVGN